jgi:hypothetical protein
MKRLFAPFGIGVRANRAIWPPFKFGADHPYLRIGKRRHVPHKRVLKSASEACFFLFRRSPTPGRGVACFGDCGRLWG